MLVVVIAVAVTVILLLINTVIAVAIAAIISSQATAKQLKQGLRFHARDPYMPEDF